jgi:hypothetical protein
MSRRALIALVTSLRAFTRHGAVLDPALAGADSPLRHAVLRVDFLVSPPGEGDTPA